MANCIRELKAWPLRGGVMVISVVSWLLALGFIAYFFGLYLGDVKLYGDRRYYMSVYVNQSQSLGAWNTLIKRAKTLFDKLCRDFLQKSEDSKTEVVEEVTARPGALALAPYWAWSLDDRKKRAVKPHTASRLPAALRKIDNETDHEKFIDTSLSRVRRRIRPLRPKLRMEGLPWNIFIWSTAGPRPDAFALEDKPASPFYPGLIPLFVNGVEIIWRVPPVSENPFSLAGFETEETKTTKGMRLKCLALEGDYLEDLLETVRHIQKDFVDSVQGRLHLVILVLDLSMVLLNSILCVSSFMLLIGAHTKIRLLILPWICISGVCVYGNIIYGILHIVLVHSMGFFVGAITVVHVIFIIIIIVLHAVALAFVHRYMLNLFHRDRRRPRR